tara:strand:+ start:217 stop:465 length:249 start_codon:yes stop_codon:yes gene_type:complete
MDTPNPEPDLIEDAVSSLWEFLDAAMMPTEKLAEKVNELHPLSVHSKELRRRARKRESAQADREDSERWESGRCADELNWDN